jgi:hypothetical protein
VKKVNSNNSTKKIADISLSKAALFAGLGLLIMAVLAPIAFFNGLDKMLVTGDATATANNVIAAKGQFPIIICTFLIIAILDLVVAWALYILFKPVNKSISLLASWFRLIYAGILGIALLNLFIVSKLLSGASYLTVFDQNQLNTLAMLFFNAFTYVWDIGLVFFGLHLLVLGYLVFKSVYFPKFLGILLIIASAGYIIDSFGKFLLPNYSISIAQYAFVGEALLIFWLLWRGVRGFKQNEVL